MEGLSGQRKKILRQAAELLESINDYKRAADCYYDSKDYDKAGRIYHQHCGESELKRAGECFFLSGSYELAAQVFAQGNFIPQCLSSCTKGSLFDVGLQYIQNWRQWAALGQLSPEKQRNLDKTSQSFLENCILSCHEKCDDKGVLKFVKAFSSVDSMRDFLWKSKCFEELMMLEDEIGDFATAAEFAKSRGDVLLEISMLEKAGKHKEANDLYPLLMGTYTMGKPRGT